MLWVLGPRLAPNLLCPVHSFDTLETCGCLRNKQLQSLRCKGSELEPERARSRPTQSTSPQVCPTGPLALDDIDPPPVFRDQLYKHIETVEPGDFDGFYNKLVTAGGQLEFLKYADALFELLLVGGLLQPGGSFLDDGAPKSPFSIFNAKEPVEVADVKNYVEVLNKLVRRCALSSEVPAGPR